VILGKYLYISSASLLQQKCPIVHVNSHVKSMIKAAPLCRRTHGHTTYYSSSEVVPINNFNSRLFPQQMAWMA
jgi:hypothetical protein